MKQDYPLLDRMRRYKAEKKLTFEKLAAELGFSTDTIRQFFYARKPGEKNARLIAYFLAERGF